MFKALLVALMASCTALVIVTLFTEDQIAKFLEYLSTGFMGGVIAVIIFTFIAMLFRTSIRRSHE